MCLILAPSSWQFYKNLIFHDKLQSIHARRCSHVASNHIDTRHARFYGSSATAASHLFQRAPNEVDRSAPETDHEQSLTLHVAPRES